MNLHPAFITNEKGHRTHVVIPIEEWVLIKIPTVEPDELDLQAMEEIQSSSADELKPAPITNPIRKARCKAGISQAELASRMGITAGMLSRMEREGRQVRPSTVARAKQAIKASGEK